MRARAALAAALLACAPLAARADIVPLQRLVTIMNANPPLAAARTGERWWVSVAKGATPAGYLDPTLVDYGYTRERIGVLIVPLPSGGSGGVFTTLLFAGTGRVPHYVGKLDAQGHLDVHLAQGRIEARTPVYGPHDPNCCPSGHNTVRYRIEAEKIVKSDEFSTHE